MLGKIYQHVEDTSAWIKDITNFLVTHIKSNAMHVNEYNAYIYIFTLIGKKEDKQLITI